MLHHQVCLIQMVREGTITVPISGSQVVRVTTQNPTDSSGNQTENIVITSDTSFPDDL